MNKQIDRNVTLIVLVSVVVSGMMLGSINATAQSSSGEIEISPSEVQLNNGESKTVDVNYDSSSDIMNPRGLEFDVNYDPEVISITNVEYAEYLSGGIDKGIEVRDGTIELGRRIDSSANADGGTVATISIKLADGVDEGDTTNVDINNVIVKADSVPVPDAIGGTVEAAEGTEEISQGIEIVDPTISGMPVDSSSSTHTLDFDVNNVSADGEPDNVTVTLPTDTVVVEEITETTVTDSEGVVEPTSPNPANRNSPGNEINFTINPETESEVKNLTVNIEMKLSTTS